MSDTNSDTITIESKDSWISPCPTPEINQKSFLEIQTLEDKYVDIVFESMLSPSIRMNKSEFSSLKSKLASSSIDHQKSCCVQSCSLF